MSIDTASDLDLETTAYNELTTLNPDEYLALNEMRLRFSDAIRWKDIAYRLRGTVEAERDEYKRLADHYEKLCDLDGDKGYKDGMKLLCIKNSRYAHASNSTLELMNELMPD